MTRIPGIRVEIPDEVKSMMASIQQPMNDIQSLMEDEIKATEEDAEFLNKTHKIEV
jgi:hypothetical protein